MSRWIGGIWLGDLDTLDHLEVERNSLKDQLLNVEKKINALQLEQFLKFRKLQEEMKS